MPRKIIVYNSFVHDANPHATLLTRQLAEVDRELVDCPARDKKALLNERRLIKTKLRGIDLALGAKAEAVVHKFVLGVLSKSEALQTLMTEGFSTQTATRLVAAAATKMLQRDQDAALPVWVTEGLIKSKKEVDRCANEVKYGNAERWGPKLAAAQANLESFKLAAKKFETQDALQAWQDTPRMALAQSIVNKAERDLGTLSPGQRRDLLMDSTDWSSEFIRQVVQALSGSRDGMGSPEDIAYGLGWHSRSSEVSPYDDPALTKSWEKGRKDAKQKSSMGRSYFMGEVRGKRFERPTARDQDGWTYYGDDGWYYQYSGKEYGPFIDEPTAKAKYRERIKRPSSRDGTGMWEVMYTLKPEIAKREGVALKQGEAFSDAYEARKAFDYYKRSGECSSVVLTNPHGQKVNDASSRDFKSEKGYVGRLVNVATGGTLAKSEPFISDTSAKRWIQEKASEYIKAGKRVKAEVLLVFFDPNLAS
jgi:hypothetical protein